MTLLLSFVFLLVIVALYLSTATTDIENRSAQYRSLAQQMVFYHVAAARACGTTCTGPIDPTPELSTFRQGQGSLAANAAFRSVSQNGYVITYYVNPNDAATGVEYYAGVMAGLVDARDSDTQMFIGQYDQAAGALRLRADAYWVDPQTGVATQGTVPNVPMGGIPAPDGAPVLVNRR